MPNCQNVNIVHTDTYLISLEFLTWLYEQATAITITDDMHYLFISCLHQTDYCKLEWQMHVQCVRSNICGFKVLSYRFTEEKPESCDSLLEENRRHLNSHRIKATSPSKTQHVSHRFSAVQQECLALKMEATQPFEACRTASHPSRTEQSATPLIEPAITQ